MHKNQQKEKKNYPCPIVKIVNFIADNLLIVDSDVIILRSDNAGIHSGEYFLTTFRIIIKPLGIGQTV